jgi:hypothetical protein
VARGSLAVQQIKSDGLSPVYTPATADGHAFVNDGEVALHVINGGASPVTVTIETPLTIDGLAVSDRTITIPAGEERFVGGLSPRTYNQADGTVFVNAAPQTSVTYAALRV